MLKLTPEQQAVSVASNLIQHHRDAATRSRNTLRDGMPEMKVTGEQLKNALGEDALKMIEASNKLILGDG